MDEVYDMLNFVGMDDQFVLAFRMEVAWCESFKSKMINEQDVDLTMKQVLRARIDEKVTPSVDRFDKAIANAGLRNTEVKAALDLYTATHSHTNGSGYKYSAYNCVADYVRHRYAVWRRLQRELKKLE